MEQRSQNFPEVVSAQPPPYYRPEANPAQPISVIGAPVSQSVNNTTTVVINQQPVGGHGPTYRVWSTGICGCFSDCEVFFKGVFCYPCLECQVASDMGEACCLPYCVPGWLVVLRAMMRTQRNIKGSVMDDFLTVCWCPQLALCQLAREIKAMRQEQNSPGYY